MTEICICNMCVLVCAVRFVNLLLEQIQTMNSQEGQRRKAGVCSMENGRVSKSCFCFRNCHQEPSCWPTHINSLQAVPSSWCLQNSSLSDYQINIVWFWSLLQENLSHLLPPWLQWWSLLILFGALKNSPRTHMLSCVIPEREKLNFD